MDATQYGDIARTYTKFKNLLADYDEFLDSPHVYKLIEDKGLHFEANTVYSQLKFLMDTFLDLLKDAEKEIVNEKKSLEV
jgi:Fe2+ or Zn2+ uptake regulation protein